MFPICTWYKLVVNTILRIFKQTLWFANSLKNQKNILINKFIRYFVQSGKSEKPQRRASIKEAPIPHKFRPRNKTVSGESNQSNDSGLTNFAGSRFFSRTYSRNPDVMTPLSSFPSEEWRRLFDRYDLN